MQAMDRPSRHRPYLPERVVDTALAKKLLESQFPELGAVFPEPIGVGWDNTVFRVAGAPPESKPLVVRFPRRQIAVALLETEARALPYLADQLPVAIPEPSVLGQPSDEYPWPFLGYPEITGTTACSLHLRGRDRRALAVPLARFLAALHSIPIEETRPWNVPGDTLGRLDLSMRLDRAHAALTALGSISPHLDLAPSRALLEDTAASVSDLLPTFYANEDLRGSHLVHGDLYARHLVLDEKRALAGVIDWGDLHAGHPAVDLAIAFTFLGAEDRAHFFAAYGPVPDEWNRLARFRALYHTCAVAQYAAETGDSALYHAAEQSLHHLFQEDRSFSP